MPNAKVKPRQTPARLSTTRVDSRRRVVMPTTLPPDAVVTIQQLEDDCWVVRRVRPSKQVRMISVPVVDKLPKDSNWERVETAFAGAANRELTPFEE